MRLSAPRGLSQVFQSLGWGAGKLPLPPPSLIETKLKGFGPAALGNPAPSRRLLCCSSRCSLRPVRERRPKRAGDPAFPLPADCEAAAPSFQLSDFIPAGCQNVCCIAESGAGEGSQAVGTAGRGGEAASLVTCPERAALTQTTLQAARAQFSSPRTANGKNKSTLLEKQNSGPLKQADSLCKHR